MEGLAAQMVYGSGENQNIKHSYAKPIPNKKRKTCKKQNKSRKKL